MLSTMYALPCCCVSDAFFNRKVIYLKQPLKAQRNEKNEMEKERKKEKKRFFFLSKENKVMLHDSVAVAMSLHHFS